MPKTDVHIAASVRKTGKGHHAVQGFVDYEPEPFQIDLFGLSGWWGLCSIYFRSG